MKKIILKQFILITLMILVLLSCNTSPNFRYISKNIKTIHIFDNNYVDHTETSAKIKVDSLGNIIKEFYNVNNKLEEIYNFSDTIKFLHSGPTIKYHKNGQIESILKYDSKGKNEIELTSYFENGKIRRIDYYDKVRKSQSKCFDSNGKEIKYFDYFVEPGVDIVEMAKKLEYPREMRKQGIEEKLYFDILINKFGKIVKLKYDNQHSNEFINECLRVFKELSFTPATCDGNPVDCWITVPVIFKLR